MVVKSTEVLVILDEITDITDTQTHRIWFEGRTPRLCHINSGDQLFWNVLTEGELEDLMDAVNFAIHQMDFNNERSSSTHVVMIQRDDESYDRLWFERPTRDEIYLRIWRPDSDIETIWIGNDELAKFGELTLTAMGWLKEPKTQVDTETEEAPPKDEVIGEIPPDSGYEVGEYVYFDNVFYTIVKKEYISPIWHYNLKNDSGDHVERIAQYDNRLNSIPF